VHQLNKQNFDNTVLLFSTCYSTKKKKERKKERRRSVLQHTHTHALNKQLWFKSGSISFVLVLRECYITTQFVSICIVWATVVNNPNTQVSALIAVNQFITQAIRTFTSVYQM